MVSRELMAGLIRNRFDRFVYYFFELCEGEAIEHEPYLEALCFALQSLLQGDGQRLLIAMPPRHLKSYCASVALPAFALGLNPRLKIAIATYSHELGREHAEKFERIITSPAYRAWFPDFQLAKRGNRWDVFRTTAGGSRRSVAVTGGFTGMGADMVILDDLIKAQDANSAVMRQQVEDYYRNTAVTRLNNQRWGKVIAVQQRLHVDDFVASLVEIGGFEHLNLPIIAARDESFPIYRGQRWERHVGDLLSPARFPPDVLARLQAEMGAANYAAQWLLDPQATGGYMIDWSRVHVVEDDLDPAHYQFVVQSIDTAVKTHDGCDYTASTIWGHDGERWRVLNASRFRLDYAGMKAAVLNLARQFRVDTVLIEDANVGAALWADMRNAGLRALSRRAHADKAERFSVALEALYSDTVEFCRNANGFDELRSELMAFPSGRHDDYVDTVSQFIAYARRIWIPEEIAYSRGQRPPSRPRERSQRRSMYS